MSALWGLWAYKIYTITLEDLELNNCSELPSLQVIDKTFRNHKEELSSLLDKLGNCSNNNSVCEFYDSCREENYADRKLKNGNTKIRWKLVSECRGQNKGAVLISYTSGCEIAEVNSFLREHFWFSKLPIDYYNY